MERNHFIPNFGVEYHLVDSCNLRCAGCSHYSSLLDKLTYPTKEFILNDLSLLKDKVGDNLKWLRLLGGEPLLHPNVTECLKEIRILFPNTDILLLTNGLLLPKMKQEFFDTCRNSCISIQITDYGVMDLEPVFKRLQDSKINIVRGKTAHLWNYQYIRTTNEEIDCYTTCVFKRICNNYRDGKIYLCPHIAYIDIFNNCFGQSVPLTVSDYVDIRSANSFDELCKALSESRPNFCYKHCNRAIIRGEWRRTSKDINEFCLR